jgi:hypothetical protein
MSADGEGIEPGADRFSINENFLNLRPRDVILQFQDSGMGRGHSLSISHRLADSVSKRWGYRLRVLCFWERRTSQAPISLRCNGSE